MTLLHSAGTYGSSSSSCGMRCLRSTVLEERSSDLFHASNWPIRVSPFRSKTQDLATVEPIRAWPLPLLTRTEVQKVLHLVSYYRNFIAERATIVSPLADGEGQTWTDTEEEGCTTPSRHVTLPRTLISTNPSFEQPGAVKQWLCWCSVRKTTSGENMHGPSSTLQRRFQAWASAVWGKVGPTFCCWLLWHMYRRAHTF